MSSTKKWPSVSVCVYNAVSSLQRKGIDWMNEFLNYPRQYKVGSRIEQTFTNFLIYKIGRI